MKNKFAVIFCLIFYNVTLAQDSNLFQTWYLYQLEADLEGVVWDIEVAQPEFSPYLTISSDMTFNGIGACNGFSGYYTYDANQNSLFPNDVYFTLSGCETSEEVDFESIYFPHLEANTNHTITLTTADDFMELRLENFPGYVEVYKNVNLSTFNQSRPQLEIYPNPVSDKLTFSINNHRIRQISVYDVLGNLIIKEELIDLTVNTSSLSKGIYFIEITLDKGKVVKKFVKS